MQEARMMRKVGEREEELMMLMMVMMMMVGNRKCLTTGTGLINSHAELDVKLLLDYHQHQEDGAEGDHDLPALCRLCCLSSRAEGREFALAAGAGWLCSRHGPGVGCVRQGQRAPLRLRGCVLLGGLA